MAGAALIHVIDDDPSVCASVAMLLETAGLECRTYHSADAFLEMRPAATGCVVTDIMMPNLSGLDLLKVLEARGQDLPVIVITGHATVRLAVECLKHGAVEFIEKPYDDEVLLDAIRSAMARQALEQERSHHRTEAAQRLATLSQRERDVLGGVVEGLSNKEIAIVLGISPRTVESYRSNIMMKGRVATLSELVRLVMLGQT